MSGPSFDDEKISHMIAFFTDRLNLVFAHFYCTFEFDGDADFSTPTAIINSRASALRIIQSACQHTTLTALRDIDDVLSIRRKIKPDDLRISDFGFSHGLDFLSPSERENIHKIIVHSTLAGAEPPSRRWDIFDLTTKCIYQSFEFLEWIERNRDCHSAFFCRVGIQGTYDYVAKKLKERQIRMSL